jgi:hypothetical protein
MNKPRYVPVRHRNREEILKALSGGNPNEMRDALISAAYWEQDWKWAQHQLLNFAEYDDQLVQWAVATGLGFIAAFNGEIDEAAVRPVLSRLKASPSAHVVNAAEDAETEIDHFVKARREGQDIDLAERLPEGWRPPSGHFPE